MVQMGHGLVPDLEPLPKYPDAHRHWFCDVESAGLSVLLGQTLFAPAMHQEFEGHGGHMLPSRKYPALHIQGHDVTVLML